MLTTSAEARKRMRVVVTARWRHVLTMMERALRREIESAALTPDAQVIDYGCADQPYRRLLPTHVHYRGADLPGNDKADLTVKGGRLPLGDDSVDFVLSTQVLEHVADPMAYLTEARRVLKPGGALLLSTHGTFMFHPDPEDFWRWTHTGLARLLRNAGFEIQSLNGVVGAVPTAIQYLVDHLDLHITSAWVKRCMFWCAHWLIRGTDSLYSQSSRKIGAMVYVIRARKA